MAMVLLYLVVLTTWLTAGLYAKYTTHASSTDDARVAEWDVSATGEENAELTVDCTVAASAEDGYQITVQNASEVAVTYDIKIKLDTALPAGITAKLDGNQTAQISADRKSLTFSNAEYLATGTTQAEHSLNFVVEENAKTVIDDYASSFEVAVDIVQVN